MSSILNYLIYDINHVQLEVGDIVELVKETNWPIFCSAGDRGKVNSLNKQDKSFSFIKDNGSLYSWCNPENFKKVD